MLSSGSQTNYYQQPGNSTLQSGPLQQHQANYGLQGNVFGTHSQSHTSGLQNFGFMSQMQIAAAMNVQQQFRSQQQALPGGGASYMKSIGAGGTGIGQPPQLVNEQGSRSQQLKSPAGQQQEVLSSSVFNTGKRRDVAREFGRPVLYCVTDVGTFAPTGPQVPSPKSRQNCKQQQQPPPQPSPTTIQHKYLYQGVGNNQQQQSQVNMMKFFPKVD